MCLCVFMDMLSVWTYWRPGEEFYWTEPVQNHCWQNTGTLLHSPLVVLHYGSQSPKFLSAFALSPWDLSQYWKTSRFFAMRTWARRQCIKVWSLQYCLHLHYKFMVCTFDCVSVEKNYLNALSWIICPWIHLLQAIFEAAKVPQKWHDENLDLPLVWFSIS